MHSGWPDGFSPAPNQGCSYRCGRSTSSCASDLLNEAFNGLIHRYVCINVVNLWGQSPTKDLIFKRSATEGIFQTTPRFVHHRQRGWIQFSWCLQVGHILKESDTERKDKYYVRWFTWTHKLEVIVISVVKKELNTVTSVLPLSPRVDSFGLYCSVGRSDSRTSLNTPKEKRTNCDTGGREKYLHHQNHNPLLKAIRVYVY